MAQFTFPPVSVDTTGLATEGKQDVIVAELQDIETDVEAAVTELQTLNAVDFAKEAKQDTAILELQDIEADVEAAVTELQTLNTTDFATEAKQDTVIQELQDIETDVEAAVTELQTANTNITNQTLVLDDIETAVDALNQRVAGNLVPEKFDFISMTYVTVGNGIGEIETVTYKEGGSAGPTVATLTLAYDANDRLSSVTRS